jgi:hypothetical protein
VEPDSRGGAVLELAAAIHFHHRTDGARARGNRDAVADLDVARDLGVHLVFDARRIARQPVLRLQADHRIGGDDELFERLLRRLGCAIGSCAVRSSVRGDTLLSGTLDAELGGCDEALDGQVLDSGPDRGARRGVRSRVGVGAVAAAWRGPAGWRFRIP